MGPELETTGVKAASSRIYFTHYPAGVLPGQEPWMLDAMKSLIYNIYLMAGQTRNYDLRAAGDAQMAPLTERYRLD